MASGAYTHTHTHMHTLADESDYKKPGVPWGRCAPGLKIQRFLQEEYCLQQVFINIGKVHKVPVSPPCFDKVLQTASVELCRDLSYQDTIRK